MGMAVVLQDENCSNISEPVYDPQEVFSLCLPRFGDIAYPCLRFVDPYGDTLFNHLQAAAVLEEWDRLKESFCAHGAEQLWSSVGRLIAECSEEPHTFTRFMGE